MNLSATRSEILLCNEENILIFNLNDEKEIIVPVPKLSEQQKQQLHLNTEDSSSSHFLTTITTSKDDKFMLICVNRKVLHLFDKEKFMIL